MLTSHKKALTHLPFEQPSRGAALAAHCQCGLPAACPTLPAACHTACQPARGRRGPVPAACRTHTLFFACYQRRRLVSTAVSKTCQVPWVACHVLGVAVLPVAAAEVWHGQHGEAPRHATITPLFFTGFLDIQFFREWRTLVFLLLLC